MGSHEISDEIRSNFHLFWDNFPFAVMLVHKDRTIIEVNRVAQAVGYPVGIRCVDMGEKKFHAGCRANTALRERTGVRDVAYIAHLGQVLDTYWIPLTGAEDFYIHFAADITAYAAERLLPQSPAEEGAACLSCRCG